MRKRRKEDIIEKNKAIDIMKDEESFVSLLMELEIFELSDKERDWIEQEIWGRKSFEEDLKLRIKNHLIKGYVDMVLDYRYLDLRDRVIYLVSHCKEGSNVGSILEYIDNVGNVIKENELVDQLAGGKSLIKIVTNIVNMDKNIIWGLSKFLDRKAEEEERNLYRQVIGVDSKTVFEIVKKDYESDFIVKHCVGGLSSLIGVEDENMVGNSISVAFDPIFRKKLENYVEDVGVVEFVLNLKGRDLRIFLSITKKELYGNEVIEVSGHVSDITELNTAEKKRELIMYKDSLTGLANRELFEKRLGELVNDKEKRREIGVVFIDIDDFKMVNDEYGHGTGDLLLIEVANRLKSCVRKGDIVARLGGDEFTIIFTSVVNKQGFEEVAERIITSISGYVFELGDVKVDLTMSMGIAMYPRDGSDSETILNNADIAMYKAKNSGKNSYKFFDESMNTEVVRKLKLQNELRKTLNRKDIGVDFQIIYDNNKGRVVGIESLARWSDDEGNNIDTIEFLKIAEESGMMVELGYIALDKSCKMLKSMMDINEIELELSVNMNEVQFLKSSMPEDIELMLLKNRLKPHNLVIEITEETSMSDVEKVREVIQDLGNRGIRVYLDDFGTGMVSIDVFSTLGLAGVKIDKQLVDRVTCSEGRVKVSAIINFVKSLDFDIIAEGVESREQMEILKGMGCNKFQGYFIGRPSNYIDVNADLHKTF